MTCMKTDAAGAAEFLKSRDRFVILTHASPDGDTLGSGYALNAALQQIGKQSVVLCPDAIPDKFRYLVTPAEDFAPQTVVAVDVADEKLLGSLQEKYAGKTELCIDHHGSNTGYAGLLYLEGDSAAACECVYNVITALGAEITPYIAGCLYTGLATDTGCFKFSNTTPRTHLLAARLMEAGADYSEINRVMFEVKSRSRVAMERLVLENMEFCCDGRCAILTVTQDMIQSTGCDEGDLDGITALSRQIEGVEIGVTVREKADGKYKVSLRTFPPHNAAEIAAYFGGGGHVRAAGCEFDCSLREARKRLKAKIAEALG